MKNAVRCILRGKQYPNVAERSVGLALHEITAKAPADLKADLRRLRIISCHELPVTGAQKVIVVQVPFMQRTIYRKVQAMLAMQIEKKLGGKHIVFVTKRTIVPKPRLASEYRSRSMTVTNVHEAILHDVVYPASIIGERTRYTPGRNQLRIILLDNKDKAAFAPKLKSFRAAYKKITGVDAVFEFPVVDQE